MVAISRAFSCSLLPNALRAVIDCANRRLSFSNSAGVFPVMIEFSKHEGVKGVMDGGGNLRRNNSMSFSVHQQDARCSVEFVEVLSDPHLLRAARVSVLGLHLWPVIRP